ncbi:MAG TPA: response regulator [Gemmatimonadota bacterium]|nr:response regulator [Gemmatimonadota bacterium]
MRRILIIDDDDVMREAAAASLSTVGGYRVLSTGDPEEGLRLARAEAPDGVLLDVSMPGMEGPEVVAALKGDPATRDIPVVFFTGGSKSVAADRWRELGVSGTVAKPFDFPLLPEQFARMVGWNDDPEAEAPAPDPVTPVPTTIQGIWERRREEVEGRVRTIEDVALALMEGRLTGDLLQDGIRAAHKLTGTLGSFGFAGGSVLAGEAEALLREGESPPGRSVAVRLSELVLGLDRTLEQGPAPIPAPARGNLEEEPEGPDPPAEEPRQRRVGVDAGVPAATRTTLAGGGVDVVAVATDDPETDPSAEVDVLVLHIDDDADTDAAYNRCRAVRERCADPAFPILLSIPRHDEESIRRAFSAGADDVVARPIVGPELLARVDGQLDRVRLRSSLPLASDNAGHGGDGRAERHVDVVIVDDDAALSDLLDHTLRLRGYSVERFADGADAAAALIGDPPAVSGRAILLDVGLPGLNGTAVLRRLRREGVLRRTRVLMLTSHAMESEVLKALELGATDHVAKPFSMPVLMHRLQRALMG